MRKEYRNVIRSKKMIRGAFLDLLGEKKRIETITVSELAERADIAKSTFYNHYADVYAVAEEFEDELIANLSDAMDGFEQDIEGERKEYFCKVIAFLEENEQVYRRVIACEDVLYVIEKLKLLISQKMFEDRMPLPLSSDKKRRYVQIRFLTNACVDTIVDYFKGRLDITMSELKDILLFMLDRVAEPDC